MPGGIHHVVHAVRDLDAAGDAYRRLGFQVGARNRHPWGTENRTLQLSGSYIELLSVVEPEKIPPHASRRLSFGAAARAFLADREGLAMLALESRDANADAAAFRAAGIGDFDVFHFEREGKGPGGQAVKVAFSLAFVKDPASPQAEFFACQEHFPENFWNPAAQVHPNSSSAISGIVLVADEPWRHGNFLTTLTRVAASTSMGGTVAVATARGTIQVIDPASFRGRFGFEPPGGEGGLRLAALRFAVADFGAAVAALKAGAVEARMRDGRIVVGPDMAAGAVLVFEAS